MMMKAGALVRYLLLHRFAAHLVAALVALLLGALAAGAYRHSDESGLRHLLDTLAQRQAVQLEGETLRGKAMGAVSLLGINEPLLKAVALGRLAPNAPEALARLQPVRQALGAEGLYVMNADGIVVADASEGASATGRQVQDRPYWQQAFAGVETIYPAVEADSRRRSFYLAAPLYEQATRGGPVIGAVALKLPAEDLDLRLRRTGEHAMLVSPQGVVFASTDERWSFRLTRPLSPPQLEALRALGQFGPDFDAAGKPQVLPFDLGQDAVNLLGRRHLRARASLQWPDPAGGRWQLVLLAAPEQQVPLSKLLSIGAAVALLAFSLQYMLLRVLQDNAARRAALAHSEAASRELMQLAQLKARQSELTLALQHARELPALVSTLFGELGRFLPVHQGSLYFAESVDTGAPQLCLAGAYATDSAPERLAFGDGLLGQCARERRSLMLTDIPAGFWNVSTGLGQALPSVLLLLPVMRNDALLGVLEIASLDPEPGRIQSVVEGLLPVLAMNLEVLLAERRMGRLLGEARAEAARNVAQQAQGSALEPWLRSVLDGAPVVMLLLDEHGRVLLSNRAAQVVFGYDSSELDGMPVQGLLPELTDLSVASAWPTAAAETAMPANRWRSGIRGRRKDGQAVELAVARSAIPASDSQGPCACLVMRPE